MKDKILNMIKTVWVKLDNRIQQHKINTDIIKFIVGYIIFIFTLFLVGWFFLWYQNGTPDLILLLKGIEGLSTPALLAVIKFVCDAGVGVADKFIDKNNNGIDDRLE